MALKPAAAAVGKLLLGKAVDVSKKGVLQCCRLSHTLGCQEGHISRLPQQQFSPLIIRMSSAAHLHQSAEMPGGATAASTDELRDGATAESTYSEQEVAKFRALARNWWDEQGETKALHSMNKLRVQLVRDGLINLKQISPERAAGPLPLEGIRILDVGCGGGILTEVLARIGAEVTGIDASVEGIEVAKMHAEKDPTVSGRVKFICGTVEDHAVTVEQKYDALVASEIIEHVNNPSFFVKTCTELVKPSGSLFWTTLNRTYASWVAAIVLAEYVVGLLPRGTHDWNKFISPQELTYMLESNGCTIKLVHGMFYNPLFNDWSWMSPTSVNYAVHAIKNKESNEESAKSSRSQS